MSVTTEVVDDEEQHVVTAGSIITVTIGLERQGLDTFMGRVGLTDEEDNDVEELDEEDKDMVDEEEDDKEEEKEEEKKKGPVWKKSIFLFIKSHYWYFPPLYWVFQIYF